MTTHRSIRALAVSSLLLALSSHAALAQDANALGERLKAAMLKNGMTINWSGITQNGSQVVLEGVTFGVPNAPAGPPIGTITLDEVTEENGGYRIGKVTFPSYTTTQEGTTFDLAGVVVTGLTLPPESETDPVRSLMLYDSLDLSNVSVKQGETPVFTMSDLHVELNRPEGGEPLEFSGAAEKFTIDFSTSPDPQTKAVMDALGYTNMNGFFEMAGAWQPTDGSLSLSQYDLTVENAGTLGITFDLGGYTPAFIKSLQDLQAQMAAQPAGTDNSAQGLAMLGLMQQLNFQGLSVRFDDDSLTNKVVDFVAKQQGVSANDIKNQAKAIVPFATAQLGNPELSQSITAAVNSFLDNPQSIEVAAQPASPVPFAQIAATATGNPLELTRTLGLTVTANQAAEESDADDQQ